MEVVRIFDVPLLPRKSGSTKFRPSHDRKVAFKARPADILMMVVRASTVLNTSTGFFQSCVTDDAVSSGAFREAADYNNGGNGFYCSDYNINIQ